MDRELKIVITIFLVFFIYGISSLFNLGTFITPFFLDKIILTLVAIAFYLLNFKMKNSYVLLLYFVAMLANTLSDEFTISFLFSKWPNNFLLDNLMNPFLVITFLFLFFGYFIFASILLFRENKNLITLLILLSLLFGTVLFIGSEIYYLPDLTMGFFLLLFFVMVRYLKRLRNKVLEIVASEFLLLFLLNTFKYFL